MVNESPPDPDSPPQPQPPEPTPEDPRKHAPVKDPPARPGEERKRIASTAGEKNPPR